MPLQFRKDLKERRKTSFWQNVTADERKNFEEWNNESHNPTISYSLLSRLGLNAQLSPTIKSRHRQIDETLEAKRLILYLKNLNKIRVI